MFWILRKWSPWQRGACERTSFFVDTSGFRVISPSAPQTEDAVCREPKGSKQRGRTGRGRRGAARQGGGVLGGPQTDGHTDRQHLTM